MGNKKKIFVSSTYHDLVAHRRYVRKVLETFDVLILGMETFGARKTPPIETCLKEVEKCDIYIGIIAYKYGSVHHEFNKSYTQIEYERAIEQGKDVLIYLFSDEGFIQPRHIDFGEKAKKLQEFKEILIEKHTYDTFETDKELGYIITKKLEDYKIKKTSDTFIRPRVIEADVIRKIIKEDIIVIFIGILDNKPVEIFIGKEDDDVLHMPHAINRGIIILNHDDDGNERYDFQYIDKHGYRTTFEGISYKMINEDILQLSKSVTTLLQIDTDLKTIDKFIKSQRSIDGELQNFIYDSILKNSDLQ